MNIRIGGSDYTSRAGDRPEHEADPARNVPDAGQLFSPQRPDPRIRDLRSITPAMEMSSLRQQASFARRDFPEPDEDMRQGANPTAGKATLKAPPVHFGPEKAQSYETQRGHGLTLPGEPEAWRS